VRIEERQTRKERKTRKKKTEKKEKIEECKTRKRRIRRRKRKKKKEKKKKREDPTRRPARPPINTRRGGPGRRSTKRSRLTRHESAGVLSGHIEEIAVAEAPNGAGGRAA